METPTVNKLTVLRSTPETCGIAVESSSSSSSSSSGSGKQQMSTSLRERLKKTRRSFNSTFTVAKRLKIDEKTCSPEQENNSSEDLCTLSQNKTEHLENHNTEIKDSKAILEERELCVSEDNGFNKSVQNPSEIVSSEKDCGQCELLEEEKMALIKQIQEKEEILRRLKLVKMYRLKNDPAELKNLISKWRCSSQAMLHELQSVLSTDGNKLSLTQLIDSFGIDDKLLHYSRTEEDFEDAK